MTIPNHIAQGITVGYATTQNWIVASIVGLWFSWNDLVALHETLKGNWTGLYAWTHKLKWYTFPHAHEDILVHKKEGGRNEFYIPLEIMLWGFIFIYWIMR